MKYKGKYSLNENLLKGRGFGILIAEGAESTEFENKIKAQLGGGSAAGRINYDAGKGIGHGVEVKYGQAVQGGLLKHSSPTSSSFSAMTYTKGGNLVYTLADTEHPQFSLQEIVMKDFAEQLKADSTVADFWCDLYSEGDTWDLFTWRESTHCDADGNEAAKNVEGAQGRANHGLNLMQSQGMAPSTRWASRVLSAEEQNAIYRARGAVYMVEGNPSDGSCYLYHFGEDPLKAGCPEYDSGVIATEMKVKGWPNKFSIAFQTQGGQPKFAGMKFDDPTALGVFLKGKAQPQGEAV